MIYGVVLGLFLLLAMACALRLLAVRVSALEKGGAVVHPGGVLRTPASKEEITRVVTPEVTAAMAGAVAVYLDKDRERLRIASIRRLTPRGCDPSPWAMAGRLEATLRQH